MEGGCDIEEGLDAKKRSRVEKKEEKEEGLGWGR